MKIAVLSFLHFLCALNGSSHILLMNHISAHTVEHYAIPLLNEVLCIFYERTNIYFKVTIRHISEFIISDHQVSKLAGALAKMGVSRGDRVLVYMPMIPEAIISMLAAVRLGAVHSVVFGGMICIDLFHNH